MARRKQEFMDQGSDTDSDNSQDEIAQDDDDFEFKLHRGKKRSREDAKEDATYGIWANESDEPKRGNNNSSSSTSRRKDYLAGQSFVKAGANSSNSVSTKPPPLDNLSTTLSIEPSREDEEDVAMDLNSSDSEQDSEGNQDSIVLENENEQLEEEEEEEEEEDQSHLAPVPGLYPMNPANPQETEEPVVEPAEDAAASSLGFAPRGLGARRGGGGIGSSGRVGMGGGIGIGARGGIGPSKNVGMAMFSKSTSTLDSTSNTTPSTLEEPDRGGLGSKAGGGNALIDSLRAELNGNPPAASTSTASSSTTTPRQASPFMPPPPAPPVASTSTSVPAPRRSFLPSAPPPPSAKKAAPLSRSEVAHFSSLRTSNSIGLKLLEKMGWSASTGGGLGKEGQGIVTPIGEGQKLRKKGEGIKGGERSKVSWEEEARRKGVSVKELQGKGEEEVVEKKERKKEWKGEKGAGQGKKKEKKIRTEFKTYDEILKEQGEDGGAYEQKELLVDLSGNALPDQTISSSLPAFGAYSADPTRLPELRHNLTLLTSTLSSSLRSLAKEGSGVVQRRAYLESEESRIRKGVEKQELKMRRLEGILRVVEKVKEVESECRELLAMLNEGEEVCECLEKFGDEFDELLGIYGEEYEEMRLDEVVVGAITPICRRIFQSWDPLSNPSLSVSQLKRYRKHFLIDKHLLPPQNGNGTVDLYGNGDEDNTSSRRKQKEGERSMTAFESFMWTIWLPKIRSAINNDWTPSNPSPAVTLFSTWSPLLPAFLRDNILDQLILPKLSASVSDWSSSAYKRGTAPGLHTIVFPWLEVAGEERMQGLLEECKRRVRGWVKSGWKAKEGVPQGLEVWKDAFSKSDWDTLLLQHVLPSLGTLLREKLTINPRSQDLAPIDNVLAWKPLLRSSMLSGLIESEFFPKWGDALWVWLKSDGVNLEQVAEWYSWWKSYFPEDVVALSGVSRGFRKGLDLMNQAMALGEDVKYRLKKPDFKPKQSSSSSSRKPTTTPSLPSSAPVSTEISFRSIVEDLCSSSNLLFLSTGRTTSKGQNLFRVSENVDGKGGVLCYLEDDVCWVVSKGGEGEAEPVGVEEMIRRAKGGK